MENWRGRKIIVLVAQSLFTREKKEESSRGGEEKRVICIYLTADFFKL